MVKRLTGAFLATLLITGCGGQGPNLEPIPDDNDLPPQEPLYHQAGLVVLTESRDLAGGSFIAGTAAFVEATVTEQVEGNDPFEGWRGRCFVGDEQPSLTTPYTQPAGEPIDAGETLPVTVNGAALTQFERDDIFEYYLVPEDVTLPEDGVHVSVPGAEGGFPAMGEIAFPPSRPLVLTAPIAGEEFALDATFNWEPHTPEAVVVLAGMDGASQESFLCLTPDTGSFALPSETRAALASEGFITGSLTAASRYTFANHRQNGAELTLMAVRFLELELIEDDDDFFDDEDDFGFEDEDGFFDDDFEDDFEDDSELG